MRKIIIAVVVISILLSIFIWWKFGGNFFRKKEVAKPPADLKIFGLWETKELMKPAIDAYLKKHPGVKVTYEYTNSKLYRSRVQTKIDNNEGPDIFMLHNTWLLPFLKGNYLAPAPDSVITVADVEKSFFPVVAEDFTKNNKVYALPRGIDGLALFYNEDLIKNASIELPQTWDQFQNAAIKATVKDEQGKILTAGAALGGTGNVDHWSDILGLMFSQQTGASLEQPVSPAGQIVIKFYTDFMMDPDKKVWDQGMEPSTQAFAAGKLAFYFGPSWRAFDIRERNPSLQFKIIPVPQLPGKNVAWASYWGYAVNPKSTYSAEAWDFVKFLTDKDTQKLLYKTASDIRLFGIPYSRVELQKELLPDPLAGAFVAQGPYYKSWYLASDTQDQGGIDEEIIKYYEDALNQIIGGAGAETPLQVTTEGIKQVLDKYNTPAAAKTK